MGRRANTSPNLTVGVMSKRLDTTFMFASHTYIWLMPQRMSCQKKNLKNYFFIGLKSSDDKKKVSRNIHFINSNKYKDSFDYFAKKKKHTYSKADMLYGLY